MIKKSDEMTMVGKKERLTDEDDGSDEKSGRVIKIYREYRFSETGMETKRQ